MHNLPILNTKEVSRMFGIPMRTVKYYTELQIVELANQNPGIGNTRRYSIHNMMGVLLAWHLDNLGVSPPAIAKKAEHLNYGIARYLEEPKTAPRYMSLWLNEDIEVKVMWHTGLTLTYPASILMDLKMLHEEINDKLAKESGYYYAG